MKKTPSQSFPLSDFNSPSQVQQKNTLKEKCHEIFFAKKWFYFLNGWSDWKTIFKKIPLNLSPYLISPLRVRFSRQNTLKGKCHKIFLWKSGSNISTGGQVEKLNEKNPPSYPVPLSVHTCPSQVQMKKYTKGTVSWDIFCKKVVLSLKRVVELKN